MKSSIIPAVIVATIAMNSGEAHSPELPTGNQPDWISSELQSEYPPELLNYLGNNLPLLPTII